MSTFLILLRKVFKVFSILFPVCLMAAAVLAPAYGEFHPLLITPYYAVLWWSAGLILLFKGAIVAEVANLLDRRHWSRTRRFNRRENR